MTGKQFYPLILLIVTLFFQNCGSDNKKTAQQSSPVTTAAPTPQEPAPVEPVSAKPQENKETPVGKSVEQLRENKTNRIGSIPTGKDAELNSTLPAPPTKTLDKPTTRVGPPGYITKNDVILQTEPSQNAAKISTLKQYETVYILETIMTDEQGHPTKYPTWYRIERENKERGWVVAKGVNAGAGG